MEEQQRIQAHFTKGALNSARMIICFLLLFCEPAFAGEKPFAIANVTIIDGNGGDPLQDGTIVISGHHIHAIGKNISTPKDIKVIDGTGMTVLPGLADMHTHLMWGGGNHDILGYQRRLNAYLYAGVTTVFDLGAAMPFVQQLKQAIDSNKIQGPNIYYVGPLIDSVDPAWPAATHSLASASQAQNIVKYLKRHGAHAVKAYANLSRPQVRALIVAAKKEAMPVIVDAWARNGAEHFVTSGLHAFAHTPGRVTDQTLAIMKQNNVSIITTRGVGSVTKHARLRPASFLDNDLIKNTTPPWILAKATKEVIRARTDTKYANENFSEGFHKTLQQNVKKIFDAGIPLIAGTDTSGIFIGDETHFELELLVDAGLTPLQAITTATKNAAILVGGENEWGTLAKGKRADLLMVKGRPDQNISATRNIELVIQKGRILDRNTLVYNESSDNGVRDIGSAY